MAKNRQIITTYHYPSRASTYSSFSWKTTTTTTTSTATATPTQSTLPFTSTTRSNYTNLYNNNNDDYKYRKTYNNGFNYKTTTVNNYNKDLEDKSEIYYEKFKNDNTLPVNRSADLGVYFNGSNFGLLSDHVQIRDSFSVSFQFRTTATNGLIMIMVDSISNNSFFIELVDSQLRACICIDGEPDSTWTEFPTKILSNQVWVDVNIKIVGSTIHMDVKDKNYIKTHRNRFDLPIHGDLFIAGHSAATKIPTGMRSKKFYHGEIRSLRINNHPISWYGPPHNLTARLRNWN